jgi:CheY-like chemotaxis protein
MDILVVEDDKAVASLLVESLTLEGHVAMATGTAAAALAHLTEHFPDAVLLDLILPDRSGLEVLREIRRRRPGLPVIILTGHAESEDADRARTLGVVDVMRKPQILDNLADALRRIHIGRH